MPELPRGTVTFLFTDIAGSTRLWQAHHEAMGAAYARHDALLREAIDAHGGVVFKVIGDALQVAFPTAPEAVTATLHAQQGLQAEDWTTLGLPEPVRVRMAVHTGAVDPDADGDYRSPVLNRLGRLLGAGHGGQVLLSDAVRGLVRDRLPAGVSLQDLGAHRLKDLLEPEPIHQVVHPDLITDFPPLITLDIRPNNLPLQPTLFLGREREVEQLTSLLRQPQVRLVTLTGPGGTGKTRLALQAAAEVLEAYPDGVWFVDLSPLSDPALVPSAIAEVLGVRETGGTPLAEVLLEYLRERQVLLVLDNLEQLVPDAARGIGDLLAASPGLAILATSRIPLRLRAEREVAVPPLGLPRRKPPPTVEQLGQYEAVRLFIERAKAVRPEFGVTDANAPAIAEICHRLDGLPLAIELAAARIRMFPPEAMLRRLEQRLKMLTGGARDLPLRQQTLRGAISWSYELLSPDEQALFRRLSVFAGGATFDAIEAVAAGDELGVDVVESLERLVEHSLVRQSEVEGEPRFGMLETIREFGLEPLEGQGGAAEAHERHARYFLALAEEAELALRGATQKDWLDRLELEHDNLRTALTWTLAHDAESALRLAGALAYFWKQGAHITEGRNWLERALAAAHEPAPAVRAKALDWAGALASLQGDLEPALTLTEAAQAICRTLDDRRGVAHTLLTLSYVADWQGDPARAMTLLEEALALARDVGDEWLLAVVLNILGFAASLHGDLGRARPLLEEAVLLGRRLGNATLLGAILHSLGEVRRAEGDLPGADAAYREGLVLAWESRAWFGTMECLEGVAAVAALQGRPARAARLVGAARAHRTLFRLPADPSLQADLERTLGSVRKTLGEDVFTTAYAAGQGLPLEDAVAEAQAVADQIAGAAASER